MNFIIPVQAFVPQLESLHNLLALSLATASPTRLLFTSSIGAAIGTTLSQKIAMIPESPVESPTHVPATGYGRSKLIGERMVEAAVFSSSARATVLRLGQIAPSLNLGSHLWNPNESIPLMVRSSLTTGVLPNRMSGGANTCSWLAVDTVSKAVLEIGHLCGRENEVAGREPSIVYNIVHPRPFSWGNDFLPALKAAGLVFEPVDYRAWLEKLKVSEQRVEKNPSRKLLELWDERGGATAEERGEMQFVTTQAETESAALRNAGGYVEKKMVKALVDAWRDVW